MAKGKIQNVDLVRASTIVEHLLDESIHDAIELLGKADLDNKFCNEVALRITEMKLQVLVANVDLDEYKTEFDK